MVPQILISSSAALVLLSGLLHLQGSFFLFDRDLEPSDPEFKRRMKDVALNISPTTDMWRAWIGFNSLFAAGLLLFGAVFGYLALFEFDALVTTPVLLVVGALYLGSLVVLSQRFLFRLPAAAFALCLGLYVVGVLMQWR